MFIGNLTRTIGFGIDENDVANAFSSAVGNEFMGLEEDVFIGNGVSELIDLSLRALLNPGDEVLVPSPDYPLWSAAVTLNGGMAMRAWYDLLSMDRNAPEDEAGIRASAADIALTTTPMGLAVAPLREGKPIGQELQLREDHAMPPELDLSLAQGPIRRQGGAAGHGEQQERNENAHHFSFQADGWSGR